MLVYQRVGSSRNFLVTSYDHNCQSKKLLVLFSSGHFHLSTTRMIFWWSWCEWLVTGTYPKMKLYAPLHSRKWHWRILTYIDVSLHDHRQWCSLWSNARCFLSFQEPAVSVSKRFVSGWNINTCWWISYLPPGLWSRSWRRAQRTFDITGPQTNGVKFAIHKVVSHI